LYPFNRILALKLAKRKDELTYSLFSTNQMEKTQIVIYDFSVKKIGDYDLEGDISDVQLSATNIYTLGPKRINIYNIVAEKKNSMEKIN
jgi:hypothetical protein